METVIHHLSAAMTRTVPLAVHSPPPLDESLYALDEDELAFFKSQTGIDDEGELKKHILTIQAKAYEVKWID